MLLHSAWCYVGEDERGLNWDDSLPREIENDFQSRLEKLKMASKLQMFRYLFHELTEPPNPENMFLHVFSDAVTKAYGIVAYVRYYFEEQNQFLSKVIYSCTRIAPTKAKLSIPKKELNGLLLACQKAEYLRNILKINKENVYEYYQTASIPI